MPIEDLSDSAPDAPPERESAFADELTAQEREAFVGIEERTVSVRNGALIVRIRFSRPLAAAVNASVYAFGYRNDRPFGEMPKIHVRFNEYTHQVLDQTKRLTPRGINASRSLRELTVTMPAETLGTPDRVLVAVRAYAGEIPLDSRSWQILEMPAAR